MARGIGSIGRNDYSLPLIHMRGGSSIAYGATLPPL